ncbi:MAG: C4-dicarboxylate ABC transporter [Gammaproteobacteria bacterium]|nr:C4-dicarboxylate ABC transporter [Gammaproteobacteria bacterium]
MTDSKMETKAVETVAQTDSSRRKFLKGGLLAAGGVATAGTAIVGAPYVNAQSPIVLKMQTAWGGGNIWNDFAREYVERVHSMSGGRIQIDLLPAGAIVGAFQIMDAVSDGILDIGHDVPVYWYGKNKAASLFGTGPVWGGNANNMMSWWYAGGGKELYEELTQDIMGLNVVGYFGFPMPSQPFGWFKDSDVTTVEDIQGLKYRTVGLAADLLQEMGMAVAQLPGGEIVPAMERGVIDAFEFNNPSSDSDFGAQDVAKNYYLGSYHQASESFEWLFNRDMLESLDDDLQAILVHAVEAASTSNTATALDRYSADLELLQTESGVTVHRTSDEILAAQLEAWSTLIPGLEEDEFMSRVMDSQKAWVERTVFYELMNQPDLQLAYEHFFPGRLNM